MLGDELGHLKHVHGLFAAENFLQIRVRVDIPLVLLVLEAMLFNVDPELFDHLRPGHRALADYLRELGAHVQRLHKSRI